MGAWLSYVFFVCVAIVSMGLLWFRVARPMLEDFDLIPVNHLPDKTPDYVTRPPAEPSDKEPFQPEREPEREPEPQSEQNLARPATAGTLYSDQKIEQLKRQERDRGAAEAMGLFIGLGLLPDDRESAVMEFLFGKRGRRHQQARPIIEAAAAAAAPPPVEAPPLKIRAGNPDEYEIAR